MFNKVIEATRAQAEACLLPIGLPVSFWELLSLKVVGLLQGQPPSQLCAHRRRQAASPLRRWQTGNKRGSSEVWRTLKT